MLRFAAEKLDTLGYRLELLDEIARLRAHGRYIPSVRWPVLRSPTRFDDFIQMLCFLDNREPVLLIDVGANVGDFAHDFRTFFPKSRAALFEPNPECTRLLAERFADDGTVTLYPVAAGSGPATAVLHVPDETKTELGTLHGYNDQARGHYEYSDYATVEVDVRPLDDYQFDALPTVLKVDTQGHEVDTLRGAMRLLDRVDLLLLECSFAPVHEGREATFAECAAILHKHELVPVVFQRYGKKVNTYAFERDVLFVRRPLAARVYHRNYGAG